MLQVIHWLHPELSNDSNSNSLLLKLLNSLSSLLSQIRSGSCPVKHCHYFAFRVNISIVTLAREREQ